MKSDNNFKNNILLELIKTVKVLNNIYGETLSDTLRERNEKLRDINHNYLKINRLTCSAVVIFFSFIENTAISIKRSLLNASKTGDIQIESKNKNDLLRKDEDKLNFEDMMKIIFSILPSCFGESDYYGNIKNTDISTLFILRKIRHNIVHPKEIGDFLISLKSLDGKDINEPMIKYIEALRKVINLCASKLK